MTRYLAVLGAAALFAPAVAYAKAACPLTYQTFEFAIPHLDLEACPRSLARDGVFCRATTGNDAVHVFVFSQERDKCLVASKTFAAGEFELTLK